jgi:nucleoside-diphosphate-sugar epimerase
MRVLVTGGTGFIGAWVVRKLIEGGHEPKLFDVTDERERLRFVLGDGALADRIPLARGDIADTDAVLRAGEGCEAAVHLAGLLTPGCRADPLRGARVNVLGTLNLFEAAKRHGFRGVSFASTASVFGPDDGRVPYPVSHYGTFKLANEGNARAYWRDAGISSVALRPYVVYGPGREHGQTAGPALAMRAAARGEPYVIPFTGLSGLEYVEDTASAFVAGATQAPPGAYAFSLPGIVAGTDELIRIIRGIVPSADVRADGPPLTTAPQLHEEGLRQVLPGLPPPTPLHDGIRATVDFYRRTRQ